MRYVHTIDGDGSHAFNWWTERLYGSTPDNDEDNIHNILLINYLGYRSYSLTSQSRGVTPNIYQKYDWDQNHMIAGYGESGANHAQYYKYGLHIISIYTQNLE